MFNTYFNRTISLPNLISHIDNHMTKNEKNTVGNSHLYKLHIQLIQISTQKDSWFRLNKHMHT